ncbi:hypothetical protein [Thermomonas sp.]|jgi:hypothetical protein|uniref:hypothetical protein n=1 Tax=Thermomonas sp. TaxID=1971895 RepID=UPI002579F0D8|nr:hypothetical protein [Thermomonas sp.]
MKGMGVLNHVQTLFRSLSVQVWAGALLISLLLTSLHALAAEQAWSDAGSPTIMQEVERYKAASRPEGRAAAAAQLERLGDVDAEAWNQLGLLHGASGDAKLAEQYFNKAATAKNLNGLMNLIGLRIQSGRIAESCKAAEIGSAWPNGAGAPAMGYLGECYRLGRNGPKNAAKAEPLLMEACRWSWEPACDSAIASLRSNPTPARTKAYRAYLEKLSAANYPSALATLGIELANSEAEGERARGVAMLEKASAAGVGTACTALALIVWGEGDPTSFSKVYDLLDCGTADKRAPEIAWLFKGVIAGLGGSEMLGRSSIERAAKEGLKQAGAFAAAFGYAVPSGADTSKCEPFCDWIEVIRQVRSMQQTELAEQARQAEIERVAQELAAREAAERAAQEAAQQAAYNAQISAQNAEARRERRRRFWGGVLSVAVALATGYVQAQANSYATPPAHPGYQPPAVSAPYRPVYQPQQSGQAAGLTKICYVTTPQGAKAITVNAVQPCPVSLHSMGQPLRFSGRGYLVGESVSGTIRVCTYQGAAGQSALNLPASGVCPPSQEF